MRMISTILFGVSLGLLVVAVMLTMSRVDGLERHVDGLTERVAKLEDR